MEKFQVVGLHISLFMVMFILALTSPSHEVQCSLELLWTSGDLTYYRLCIN